MASRDSRLTVIAPLGRGGTAEVSRVKIDGYTRELACKSPLPDQTDNGSAFAALVGREWELIGRHRFPGLVRLVESPHIDPAYLLLEICEGPTIDKIGRIDDVNHALNILSAVALSLEYLRAREIIHGDLKPQNIFLPRDWARLPLDRLWYAKISDFSLGRKTGEPETARAGLGTVGYMAPEVISKKTTSHQSDLFVLGVIGYQILTGIHPFLIGDCEPVKVNSRIQEEDPTPLEEVRSDLSGHPVVGIIKSLLAKDAGARPKSAWEVCRLLSEAGSRYPYQKGIRPRYLFGGDETIEQVLSTLHELSPTVKRQLTAFSGDEPDNLARIISGNWAVGNLAYDDSRFRFVAGVRIPAYLRNCHLRAFTKLPFGERRARVRQAISLDLAKAEPSTRPQLTLLRHLLKVSTIRLYSLRIAPQVESSEDFSRATDLWLQAGDLASAERCALQAAMWLTKEERRKEALELSNRVIEFARLTSRLHGVSELLLLSGTLLKDSGDTAGAEAVYRELIAVLELRPAEKSLGIVYNKLGDLYKMRSDFDAGLAVLQKALGLFEQLDDQLEYSHTLNNLGNIYWVIGDLQQSCRQYRRALHIQRHLNVREDVASTLSNLGGVMCMLGRIGRGIFLMQKSLELKREIGNAGEIARTLNNLGYISFLTGHNARAVEYLSESLTLNRRVGSRKEILINIENLSSIMISAGQADKSLSLLGEGLSLSVEIGDSVQELLLSNSQARAFAGLGRLGDAVTVLKEVKARLNSVDDPAVGMNYLCACAEIEILLGRFERARELASQARATANADLFLRLQAAILLARVADPAGLAEEVNELIAQSQFERLRIVFQFNCAERLVRDGSAAEALSQIGNHLEALLSLEDEAELPRLCMVAAQTLAECGRVKPALIFCERAKSVARQYSNLFDQFLCGVIAGRLQFEIGDYEQSFREYRQSIGLAKRIAQSLANPQDKQDFQKRRELGIVVREIERLGLILGQKKRAGLTLPVLSKALRVQEINPDRPD